MKVTCSELEYESYEQWLYLVARIAGGEFRRGGNRAEYDSCLVPPSVAWVSRWPGSCGG